MIDYQTFDTISNRITTQHSQQREIDGMMLPTEIGKKKDKRYLARVKATLVRRSSERKPIFFPVRTVEIIIISFSPP